MAVQCRSSWSNSPGFDASSAEASAGADLVIRLVAGDVLADIALSAIAGHFSRYPNHLLAYTDEIRRDGSQAIRVFKPGWSPTLERCTRYVGRAAAYRASLLNGVDDWTTVTGAEIVERIASGLALDEVGAVRLPLFEYPAPAPPFDSRRIEAVYQGAPPSVSIVLPTRDKADLLRPCLQSLFEATRYVNFDVALVDNDSVEPRTHALMREMCEAHDRLKIIKSPRQVQLFDSQQRRRRRLLGRLFAVPQQ